MLHIVDIKAEEIKTSLSQSRLFLVLRQILELDSITKYSVPYNRGQYYGYLPCFCADLIPRN